MQNTVAKTEDNYFEKNKSKVDIHLFDKEGSRPFANFPFSSRKVYEFFDYTLRTPLEKTDAFYEILKMPFACEIWILPVTEKSSNFMREIQEPKTAALFSFLAKVKDTIQRDRTFIVTDQSHAAALAEEMEKLGFTMTEPGPAELEKLVISFGN
ncbi:hypothetical protein ABEU95_11850 [Heyndrickxia faecalis]|uniref:hypothetical protein n=1 Tax=Heyndrickxia TaxID=2837504 RepID=UPI002E1E660A|nr:hypothetical protein [Weizmannia sp. CD-2023]